jgi:hypothetical protein
MFLIDRDFLGRCLKMYFLVMLSFLNVRECNLCGKEYKASLSNSKFLVANLLPLMPAHNSRTQKQSRSKLHAKHKRKLTAFGMHSLLTVVQKVNVVGAKTALA